MTTFDIKMPKLGESITEGTIVAWLVKVGDNVQEDDILFEVTTAKVNAEIPSPVEGTVLQILVKEGDTVAVGTVVMTVQIEGEGEGENEVAVAAQIAEPSIEPVGVEDTSSEAQTPVVDTDAAIAPKTEKWYSPAVLHLANESHIPLDELDKLEGNGYLGRLSKKDIQQYIAQKKSGASTPLVKAPKSIDQTKTQLPVSIATSNADEVIEMNAVRRIIADHMVMSKKTSPHVTSFIEVDVTKLVEWRKRSKDAFAKREGISLTYMPAITEAVSKALIKFPQVNASVDGYRMILKKQINVGIAVALDDGNLVVPVVHNADTLNISGLAQAIDKLANNARANKLKIDDIQGGTFTITNFGTFKNITGTPIINQPQVAILGVGYIEKKPAVLETADGDVIAIRHKMILSLSYDHRIVDGSLGGRFLLYISEYLQNWNLK